MPAIRVEVVDPDFIEMYPTKITPFGYYYLRLQKEAMIDLTFTGQVKIDWDASPVTYTHTMIANE